MDTLHIQVSSNSTFRNACHQITSIGEVVEKLATSYTAGVNVKGYSVLENSLAVLQNVQGRDTTWLSNSIPNYISKRAENMSTKNFGLLLTATLLVTT